MHFPFPLPFTKCSYFSLFSLCYHWLQFYKTVLALVQVSFQFNAVHESKFNRNRPNHGKSIQKSLERKRLDVFFGNLNKVLVLITKIVSPETQVFEIWILDPFPKIVISLIPKLAILIEWCILSLKLNTFEVVDKFLLTKTI